MAIIDKPSDYFNTKLYAGNGVSGTEITGVGFQPNFTWIKNRSAGLSHVLSNSVSGNNKFLSSNGTAAESTDTAKFQIFLSDGFRVGSHSGVNASGNNYASWNWKAGTSFTNDASATGIGTIDSSGSTSTTAGFSIVKIDSMPASTTSTFAHNLGVKPDFIIFKSRNLTTNWDVYHSSALPDGERKLYLNDTDAVIDSGFMNDTAPTSSVVSFNPGSSVSNHIAYCFAEKQGYSKFGSYTGNGNANGTFVYTGFKPAFIIFKRSSGTGNWQLLDNKRLGFNVENHTIYPNSTIVEQDETDGDILSNGFKLRNTGTDGNGSGSTYIYMAFAEQPFVTSTGVPATAR